MALNLPFRDDSTLVVSHEDKQHTLNFMITRTYVDIIHSGDFQVTDHAGRPFVSGSRLYLSSDHFLEISPIKAYLDFSTAGSDRVRIFMEADQSVKFEKQRKI